MAVDVCSEISSPGISPRISFSHDLNNNNNNNNDNQISPRLDSCLLESDFDFFSVGFSFQQEISPADELFSNGTILPVQIKKQKQQQKHQQKQLPQYYENKAIHPPPPPPHEEDVPKLDSERKTLLKEFLSMSLDGDDEDQSQTTTPAAAGSKSFWPQFKRSNSLNCDGSSNGGRSRGGGGGSLIRSLHFLSRSHSTGSAPIPPRNQPVPSSKDNPHLRKQRSVPSSRKSPLMPAASPTGGTFHPYNFTNNKNNNYHVQPHLRKCGSYGNNGGGGVRISPVLNIPSPTFISRGTVNIFGSIFCNGKVKKKKR
ncbi:hypothetical protein LINPERPRIM_LOCUS6102 [Linum perenne]